MKILKMYESNINDRYMDEAVKTLRDGGITIYPTDTLYALGCDALNGGAIERICRIKNINPQKTPLSIICCDIAQAAEYARVDNKIFKIMRTYLPGAFTFILQASHSLPKVFKGRKTVGVRIPDNAIARGLAERLGNPILTTSIEWPEDLPEEGCEPESIALRYDGLAELIIDGGTGELIPSTVVDCTNSDSPEVVREGKGILE
jgi:tRNA threonylcarbamoyl adenosine modification protein (Sua5/YciO/YrdC/YwlC family)